ncbi:MAG: signal peptidase I [Treponemataceae bacterium]|nr:signal peptidase I [Treponemataceae bacterium]
MEKEHHTTLILPAFAGILIAILLRLFVLDIKTVSGTSMEPTITDGQHIVVFRLCYGIIKPEKDDFFIQWQAPKAGDIVTYYVNGRPVVKRCVASEGMAIAFSADSRYSLLVGDAIIPLTEQQYERIKDTTVIPDGMFLAVGDNYEESADSRDYGFVDNRCVTGKVVWK